jgi:predicted glycosyltransferase involved in capsule biosynthesis
MAVWRDDLLEVNGYDERFTGWGREDSELTARRINAGVRRRNVKFAPVAWHLWHEQRSLSSFAENDARYTATIRSGRRRCDEGLSRAG